MQVKETHKTMMSDHRTMNRTLNEHNMSESYLNGRDDLTGRIDQQFRASEKLDPITNEINRGVNEYMGRIEQQFRASEKLDPITNEINRGVSEYMGSIEHITTSRQ